MELNSYNVHGINIEHKISKANYNKILEDILVKYNFWRKSTEKIEGNSIEDIREKVDLLNEYKKCFDSVKKYFKPQDKLESTINEEFLYFLFSKIKELSSDMILLGPAKTYLDLSFAPKNLLHFIDEPGVYIREKNQDFTISKKVDCIFKNKIEKEERYELTIPAVVIECKMFIPQTMFDQAAYEAQRLKEGNPFSLFIIMAEQNALRDDVNLKHTKVDEVFILRKQKRTKEKKPIDYLVVYELFKFVEDYLKQDWFNLTKATDRGRLIQKSSLT